MEQFIYIPNYENRYKLFRDGKIYSEHLHKFMKINTDKDGYSVITLYSKVLQKYKVEKVHRLIAKAFISNPANKPTVNHINGIKSDNRIKNLEWATYSENETHSFRVLGRKVTQYWTGKFGKENKKSKPVLQYDLQGNFIKLWENAMDIERQLKFGSTGIAACCRGIYHTSRNFKWKYQN